MSGIVGASAARRTAAPRCYPRAEAEALTLILTLTLTLTLTLSPRAEAEATSDEALRAKAASLEAQLTRVAALPGRTERDAVTVRDRVRG